MWECGDCGSPRVYRFRLDADWGTAGDLTRWNGDSHYKPGDPDDRTDVDLTGDWCFNCSDFVQIFFRQVGSFL